MEKYLPLGSIVLLKNGQKRLMIYGRKQLDPKSKTVYDYASCLYPEGNMDEDTCFLFNHSDIDKIFFIGLQDEENAEFVKNVLNK